MPNTFALFYLEEIVKFKSPLLEKRHISVFEEVSKNFTKIYTPFRFMIWYLHCSSRHKLESVLSKLAEMF